MFPQVHLKADDEGDIVLHAHVYRVTDGVEPDSVGIGVIRPVHCVIQGECPLFVIRIPEDEFKQPVLVFLLRCFPFAALFGKPEHFMLFFQPRNGTDLPKQNAFEIRSGSFQGSIFNSFRQGYHTKKVFFFQWLHPVHGNPSPSFLIIVAQ